jgi:hypothetical protein
MVIRFERDLPVLLFVLVCTSALASLPQVESAWNGVQEVYGEQEFGWRILRELMLLVVIGYCVLEPRFWREALTGKLFAFLGIIATYALFEIGYALYLDLPLVVPLAGLRIFEYLPLAVIGFMTCRLGAGEYVLNKFASYLRYYIALQGVLAISQALWAPAVFGVSMLGGGRPWGTFVSPNLFGAAMATCTLVFSVARVEGMRKWMYFSVLLAVLSGSRTSMLSAFLVLFFSACAAMRARDRWALVLPAPALAIGFLILASTPLLSGRQDANLAEEGRITPWLNILTTNINEPSDLLFGWGLGLGSNTITVMFGSDHFPGQFISDSLYLFLLNGYGLIGLMAYLSLLWMSAQLSGHRSKWVVVTFIFMAGIPFNLWEYFPQNAMLMFLWGLVMGTSHQAIVLHAPVRTVRGIRMSSLGQSVENKSNVIRSPQS